MIRFESYDGNQFSISGITDQSKLPAEGKVVSVSVLERIGNGSIRIQIAGKTLIASGLNNFSSGDVFTARVRYSGSTLFLHPLPVASESLFDIFTRLGVPENPISSFLLSYFQSANFRLDSGIFRRVLSIAARFPGREKRAAEAATFLILHGIDPDDSLVLLIMDAFEGHAGGDDPTERDILSFINQKKDHERHWLVFPFKRTISNRTLTGSIRFLVDTGIDLLVQTALTVHDGKRKWEFDLDGDSCKYRFSPPLDTVIHDRIAVYLKEMLKVVGISQVLADFLSEDAGSSYSAIDLEI